MESLVVRSSAPSQRADLRRSAAAIRVQHVGCIENLVGTAESNGPVGRTHKSLCSSVLLQSSTRPTSVSHFGCSAVGCSARAWLIMLAHSH